MSAKAFDALSKSSDVSSVPQTAQSQEQNDNDDKEKIVAARKNLIRFGSLAVLAFVVWLFATIAWFAMNKSVTAGGMSVGVEGIPFKIAAKGDRVRYSTEFSSVRSDFTEGTSGSYVDSNSVSGTYYSDTDKLKLRCDVTDGEIKPGDSGVIEFYIIPTRDGDITANIALDIVSFTGDSPLTEITSSYSGTDAAEVKKAAYYTKGHIMFFQDESNSPSSYTYTGALTDRTMTYSISNAVHDVAYPVEIHWMWPKTLGQLALQTNANSLRPASNIPVIQETAPAVVGGVKNDKRLVLDYLETEKESVFKLPQADYAALNAKIEAADTQEYFDDLTDGYNDADSDIGTYVSYFLIELTITA